jgi:hypothetical protein
MTDLTVPGREADGDVAARPLDDVPARPREHPGRVDVLANDDEALPLSSEVAVHPSCSIAV